MFMEAAEGRHHHVDDVSASVNVCVLMRHSSNTHTFTYHFDIIIDYVILIIKTKSTILLYHFQYSLPIFLNFFEI